MGSGRRPLASMHSISCAMYGCSVMTCLRYSRMPTAVRPGQEQAAGARCRAWCGAGHGQAAQHYSKAGPPVGRQTQKRCLHCSMPLTTRARATRRTCGGGGVPHRALLLIPPHVLGRPSKVARVRGVQAAGGRRLDHLARLRPVQERWVGRVGGDTWGGAVARQPAPLQHSLCLHAHAAAPHPTVPGTASTLCALHCPCQAIPGPRRTPPLSNPSTHPHTPPARPLPPGQSTPWPGRGTWTPHCPGRPGSSTRSWSAKCASPAPSALQ